MRKAGVFGIAAVLVLTVGGAARAQVVDKPTSAPGVAPGQTEPAPPDRAYVLDVQQVTIRSDGKVLEAAPPGEQVSLTITLHNFSDSTARDVNVHLDPSESVRVVDGDATYGDIGADDSKDGAFSIVVASEPCQDFAGVVGTITHADWTTPLKVGIAVACPGPRLSVENVTFEGGDGDGVPEPGETLRAFVVMRNDGRDPADNVRATIKVSGKGVTTASDELTWPDLAPGRSAPSSESITVKISDDAPRQEACPPMAPDGGGVPVSEVPPSDTGTVSSDTPVSSDGSSPNTGNTSSEPGSTGSGSSGSTGTEPSQIEPVPPVTGTVEPQPAPAPDQGTPEPAPEPGTPEPQPAPEDLPVLVQMQLDISATDYTTQGEYSSGVYCAIAEGGVPVPAKGAPAADLPLAARDSAATTSRGSTALPIVFTLMLSLGAIAARKLLVR